MRLGVRAVSRLTEVRSDNMTADSTAPRMKQRKDHDETFDQVSQGGSSNEKPPWSWLFTLYLYRRRLQSDIK